MMAPRPRRSSRLRRTVAIGLIALAAVAGLAAVASGATNVGAVRSSGRVLIVSIPTVTWADLDTANAPTLKRLLDHSAVADLATRSDRQPSALGPAYVTIGTGTRAAGDGATDGEGLEVSERFGRDSAGAAYRQRTGRKPGRGLVDLAIARIKDANTALLYGAQPGALGDELAKAGYSRAVIANADGLQPDTPPSGAEQYVRPAVGALMGGDGRVPEGSVGTSLLQSDPGAPYGVRLDAAAVERAFAAAWRARSVVLVEGSDLVRADRYFPFASAVQSERQRRRATEWTDRIVARLFTHVNLARDTVVVVAPTPSTGDRSVTVAGLRTPGVTPGLLRSATTGRAGFVTLTDVAPTILGVLGIAKPNVMEGRPMRVGTDGGSPSDRRAFLVQVNADGLLRDRLVDPVTKAVIWASIVLVISAGFLLGRVAWAADALRWLALGIVGFLLATHVVTLLHVAEHGGIATYWAFCLLFAAASAAVCRLAGRRSSIDPLMYALGALLIVLVVDQFSGSHLEFNSVLGYSPTVGIRFAGIANGSSAVLTAAAMLVAALLAWRIGAPRGNRLALAVLVVAFIALTPPLFGQDFGGTIAAAPAFLLLGCLLLGRRITFRTVAGLCGVLLVSGIVVGMLDLLRPSDQRTHVGRFFEKIGNEGLSGFTSVIQRKGGENVANYSSPILTAMVVVVIAVGLMLWFRSPSLLRTTVGRIPTLRAAGIGLAVLLVLTYALNDSGIAIPAMMLVPIAAAGAYLCATTVDEDAKDNATAIDTRVT